MRKQFMKYIVELKSMAIAPCINMIYQNQFSPILIWLPDRFLAGFGGKKLQMSFSARFAHFIDCTNYTVGFTEHTHIFACLFIIKSVKFNFIFCCHLKVHQRHNKKNLFLSHNTFYSSFYSLRLLYKLGANVKIRLSVQTPVQFN